MPDSTSPEPADTGHADVVDAELVPDAPGPSTASASTSWAPPTPAFDYTEAGVPTLDYLRDKVEGRLSQSGASAELAEAEKTRSDTARAFSEAQREAEAEQARKLRDQTAADRLAAIRRDLHLES